MSAQVLASDIDEADIARAKECLKLCGFDEEDTTSAVQARTAKVDGTDLAALQSFIRANAAAEDDGLVDAIITDLPWGHRVCNAASLSVLYPGLIKSFVALLRPGGHALVMTADPKAIRNALKQLEGAVRKEALPWYIGVEDLCLAGDEGATTELVGDPELAPAVERAGRDAARSFEGKRLVECGLPVYLILLRKIPMP